MGTVGGIMERISVESLARMPPIVASLTDKASTLVSAMVSNDIGSIVVTNNDKPVRIVTEKDVMKKIVEKGANIVACGLCVNARGLEKGKEFIEGVSVGGLPDFGEMVGEADAVITL